MSTIPSGLRADIMRKSMEDKNTLTNKGSLYVGLGTKEQIEYTDPLGDTKTYDIYNTTELQIPNNATEDKLILITDSNETTGLKWGKSVSDFTATRLNSTTFTNQGHIINSGNIENAGNFTNSGNIIVKHNDTVIAGINSADGDIYGATFNEKTLTDSTHMSNEKWGFDTVIPTAKAVSAKIEDIVAAGETLINGLRGDFKFYPINNGQTVEIEGDVIASITSDALNRHHIITLTMAGVEVNTWNDPAENQEQAEEPGE